MGAPPISLMGDELLAALAAARRRPAADRRRHAGAADGDAPEPVRTRRRAGAPASVGPAARRGADGRRWRLVRAGRDAVPPSVRRFTARARQRRLRRWRRGWSLGASWPCWSVAGLVVASARRLLGVHVEVRVTGARWSAPTRSARRPRCRPARRWPGWTPARSRAGCGALPPVADVGVTGPGRRTAGHRR